MSNCMCPARVNPRLSAEAYLNGAFDFNRTLLAPPVTQVLIFKGPTKQRMFAQHGMEGWYLGPSPKHYQFHTVYFPATRAERIIKTIKFLPHNCPFSKLSSADAARQELEDLADAINNPAPASPL